MCTRYSAYAVLPFQLTVQNSFYPRLPVQASLRSPAEGAKKPVVWCRADCVCSALSLHFTCSSSRLSHIQFFLLLPFPSSFNPTSFIYLFQLHSSLVDWSITSILHRPTLPYRTSLHWGFHLLWVISPPPPTSILRLFIYIVFVIHRITPSPPRHPLLFSICSSSSFYGTLRAKNLPRCGSTHSSLTLPGPLTRRRGPQSPISLEHH